MKRDDLRKLLCGVREGRISEAEAERRLRALPFADFGAAKVDTHRQLRCGASEVVFCPGKAPADLTRIAKTLLEAGHDLLATRATPEAYRAIRKAARDAVYHERARAVTVRRNTPPEPRPGVVVVCAGTSDVPVAEEARLTAEWLGNGVEAFYDVGVAGLHRLLAHVEALQAARVVIVAAGMEGALPSVVGGLVGCPVIAVPTSVGYGVHLGGLTPFLSMMSSCSPNVVTVNVDNGFGAGYAASLINRTGENARPLAAPRAGKKRNAQA